MRRPVVAALFLLAGLAQAPLARAQDAATPANGNAVSPSRTQAAPDAAPANVATIPTADVRSILGKKVSDAAGDDMGIVVDVLFDANKQPRAVVIDFGGFLGVGTRKLAVDWKLLQFYAPDSKTPLKLELSRADVQSAPEYKPSAKTVSVIAGPLPVTPAKPATAAPPPSAATPPAPASPPPSADAP